MPSSWQAPKRVVNKNLLILNGIFQFCSFDSAGHELMAPLYLTIIVLQSCEPDIFDDSVVPLRGALQCSHADE